MSLQWLQKLEEEIIENSLGAIPSATAVNFNQQQQLFQLKSNFTEQ